MHLALPKYFLNCQSITENILKIVDQYARNNSTLTGVDDVGCGRFLCSKKAGSKTNGDVLCRHFI